MLTARKGSDSVIAAAALAQQHDSLHRHWLRDILHVKVEPAVSRGEVMIVEVKELIQMIQKVGLCVCRTILLDVELEVVPEYHQVWFLI